MAAALISTVAVALAGLVSAAVIGLRITGEADLYRHTSFGIVSTMVTLLAHSMMMFYLIGKGRAVKDALAEGALADRGYARRIAVARKPVFSAGIVAMVLTMATAIMGASVDAGATAPLLHALVACSAIAANLVALGFELAALTETGRVVDEVNRLLGP